MSNPVLVEVTRGPLVESRHRGAVAVADIEGRNVFAVGDIAAPVFPRSAIKALQAIALVECGAADRYGFGDEDLALACASHSGEPAHIAGVARMLAKAGLDASALRCGAHWPISQSAAYALARTGTPSALHNNCSGKHAGFLCLACAMGADHGRIFSAPTSGAAARCAPCWKISPAPSLAKTSAPSTVARCRPGRCRCKISRMDLPNSAPVMVWRQPAPLRRRDCGRPVRQKPWFVAGTGRFCTEIMELLRRARFRQNRRRRRLLRRAAATRARHRDQMR